MHPFSLVSEWEICTHIHKLQMKVPSGQGAYVSVCTYMQWCARARASVGGYSSEELLTKAGLRRSALPALPYRYLPSASLPPALQEPLLGLGWAGIVAVTCGTVFTGHSYLETDCQGSRCLGCPRTPSAALPEEACLLEPLANNSSGCI